MPWWCFGWIWCFPGNMSLCSKVQPRNTQKIIAVHIFVSSSLFRKERWPPQQGTTWPLPRWETFVKVWKPLRPKSLTYHSSWTSSERCLTMVPMQHVTWLRHWQNQSKHQSFIGTIQRALCCTWALKNAHELCNFQLQNTGPRQSMPNPKTKAPSLLGASTHDWRVKSYPCRPHQSVLFWE